MEKLRCATVEVPLNYADPAGRRISIEISLRQADNPAQRRGVLLMNPGGPGNAALPIPLRLEALPGTEAVRAGYDVIAFDPRGVGLSAPVTCHLGPDQRAVESSPYPRDAADVDRHARRAREIAQQCAKHADRNLLPHITTANTARDMDRIRAAVGVAKISYYGTSYGSHLGAVYATMFPWNTDRVVLDAVTGPGGEDVAGVRRFGQGFDDSFPDFAAWAAARHDIYQLGATPQAVTGKYFALAARLDRAPVAEFDGATFRATTNSVLYNDSRFPDLAAKWHTLDQGVTPSSRDSSPGAAGYPDPENRAAAQLHVMCNDADWPENVDYYKRAVRQERVLHPMFGPAAANIHPCAFWPVDPSERPVRITSRGPSNVLLVQNLRDPGTPLAGAELMRAALGRRAGLVTVDQGGHGVLTNRNACGRDAALRFLTGNQPPQDGHCPRVTSLGG
nr:secreted hydrolase [Kibdelosporangium sp. MJ126-NF4]